ncbi:MAG: hypothetical protein ABW032_07280, partial [Burkholderiaceae bacterium]
AGSAGLAGLQAAIDEGLIERGERVLLIATGNGLKDIASADLAVAPSRRSLARSVSRLEDLPRDLVSEARDAAR